MSDWYSIGAAGAGAIGNIIGIGQQNQQTQNMMNQQMQNQMHLNNQMQNIQQQNWDYTNYENQRKHIEKAGLNVGMLYGMGGAGGSTMGGASGGNAAGGHAAQTPNFMEVGAQMLQAKSIEAQTKLAEATSKKEEALANKISGVDTKETEAKIPTYAKSMELTDNQIKEIASKMGVNEAEVKEKLQGITESEQRIIESKSRINLNEAQINRINQMTPWEIKSMEQDVISKQIGNKYKDAKERAEINLMTKEAWKYVQDVINKRQEINVQKFVANMKAKYPNMQEVAGGQVNKAIESVYAIQNWLLKKFGAEELNHLGEQKVK